MLQFEKDFAQNLEAIINEMVFMVSLDNMRIIDGSRRSANAHIQYEDTTLANLYLYDEEHAVVAEIVFPDNSTERHIFEIDGDLRYAWTEARLRSFLNQKSRWFKIRYSTLSRVLTDLIRDTSVTYSSTGLNIV